MKLKVILKTIKKNIFSYNYEVICPYCAVNFSGATVICKAFQVACVCAVYVVREQQDSLKAGVSAHSSCSEVQSNRDVLLQV